MRDDQIDLLARVAADHWWYRAKRDLVVDALERTEVGRERALDAGCGSGEMGRRLRREGFAAVVGSDVSARALEYARRSPGSEVVRAESHQLPVRDGVCRVVTSLDVVEHLDDDVAALREFGRVTDPDGVIVLAVPTYQWMWSSHDVELGHRRRYTTRSLRRVVEEAGLVVESWTYFHSWLLPIAVLLRRTPLRRLVGGRASSEVGSSSALVNRVFAALAALERRLCRLVRVPFGLSLLFVVRRR